jgi:DNA-directed RNA polymerase sigma subunit (sigma70/sigma32)
MPACATTTTTTTSITTTTDRRPAPADMTLGEVAAAMGISRQRVQQIEREALGKIRAALEARGLTLDDFVDTARSGR